MSSVRRRMQREKELVRLELEEGVKQLIDDECGRMGFLYESNDFDYEYEQMYAEDVKNGLFDDKQDEFVTDYYEGQNGQYHSYYDDYYYDYDYNNDYFLNTNYLIFKIRDSKLKLKLEIVKTLKKLEAEMCLFFK